MKLNKNPDLFEELRRKERLDSIFAEATKDNSTRALHSRGYKAFMFEGIKIVKDMCSGAVIIYDPRKSGHYYSEIKEYEYDIFLEKGWRGGVYQIKIKQYEKQLDEIFQRIRHLRNNKSSIKEKEHLDNTKERICNKIYKITNKINNHDTKTNNI